MGNPASTRNREIDSFYYLELWQVITIFFKRNAVIFSFIFNYHSTIQYKEQQK